MTKRIKRRYATKMIGRVRQAMRLCADLVDTIPQQDDNIIQKGIKLISIGEIVLTHIEGERSAVDTFVLKLGLQSKTSQQFVSLFFSTPLVSIFQLSRIKISEEVLIVKAEHEIGTLYFVEWSGIGRSQEFYYDKIDFSLVLNELWSHFDGRINVRIARGPSNASDLEFTSFSTSDDEVYGGAQKKIDVFVKKHRLMQLDGFARTYLFVGPPGNGKSTQALKIAHRVGEYILRLDASSFAKFESQEMSFLLGSFKPDVLIVDDIDKGDISSRASGKSPATLLTIMEWIKSDYPKVTLLMTANDTASLPEPMLRPGRIDDWVWFTVPNKRDRAAILRGYIEKLVPESKQPTANGFEMLVAKSDGLGAAWLKEIALQCRYGTQAEVLKAVAGMKILVRRGTPVRRRDTKRIRRAPTSETMRDVIKKLA